MMKTKGEFLIKKEKHKRKQRLYNKFALLKRGESVLYDGKIIHPYNGQKFDYGTFLIKVGHSIFIEHLVFKFNGRAMMYWCGSKYISPKHIYGVVDDY